MHFAAYRRPHEPARTLVLASWRRAFHFEDHIVDEETMTPCRPGGRERLRPLIITAREHRDLDARFRRDMQALREAARRGPHPKETAHQCATRLFNQFEVLLARYERLFSFVRVPVKTGRPPRLDTRPRIDGRPPDRLAREVAAIVARDGRSVPTVARELLAEDLGTRDSAAYRRLLRARDRWLADGYGADRALLRAFAEPTFDAERARLTALIRTSRNHVKAAIRAMR